MPYKRSYRSRRRRRNYRRRKAPQQSSFYSTASKALNLASKVAGMVNAEKFHFDNQTVINPLSVSGDIFPLQLVPEGDDSTMRNGRSIKLEGLQVNSYFQSSTVGTGGAFSVTARCIFFVDWWSNGVVPTVTDLLVSSEVMSFRQVDSVSAKRFKVIMDKNILLTPQSAGDKSAYTLRRFFPLKHHLRFIGSTGTQASTGSGQVYCLVLCNGNVAVNAVSCTINTRTYYYDN